MKSDANFPKFQRVYHVLLYSLLAASTMLALVCIFCTWA